MLILLLLLACAHANKTDDSGGTGTPGGDTSAPFADTGTPPPVDADGDGSTLALDCDDQDAAVSPDAAEACNGIDDDCDGQIDEDLTTRQYADADLDGFGTADAERDACALSPGWADNADDCDDQDASIHPDQPDLGNGADDDCDGATDEDEEPVPDPPPEVEVSWDADGVTFVITGEAPAWELGMAETGVGDVGWFGESCYTDVEPRGYEDYGWQICHPMEADGGYLPSIYPDISQVSDSNTLFNEDIGNRGDITYVVIDSSSSACFAWGDDPSYYENLGCEPLP